MEEAKKFDWTFTNDKKQAVKIINKFVDIKRDLDAREYAKDQIRRSIEKERKKTIERIQRELCQ